MRTLIGHVPYEAKTLEALWHLRDRLTEAALHRFDIGLAVKMFAETAEAIGIAPRRVSVAVLSLHPSLAGVRITWRKGGERIERIEHPWGFLQTPEHKSSPLQVVMTTKQILRKKLSAGEGQEFPVLRDFTSQGATDYVAFPLFSPRPDIHVFSMWTDREGGWTDREVELLGTVMPTMSLLIEVFEAHRLTTRERVDLMLLAHTDRLTGLYNRHGILLEAENRFGSGRPCRTIYIDLDGVKGINDRLGHHFGDITIQSAAQRISACLPDGAIAGRMGGDEFVVFADLNHVDLAEQLRSTLSRGYEVHEVRFAVTASLGVATYDDVPIEELLRRADLAMLESKRSGKNTVTLYEASSDHRHERNERVSRLIPLALQRGEFYLEVQPIVSLRDGSIIEGECLARWRSLELGNVSPGEFIPAAEQTGDIRLVDRFIMKSALAVMRRLADRGVRPVPLGINLSAKESSLEHLDAEIVEQLEAHRLPPSQLVVELTESEFIYSFDKASHRLKHLRDAGISISLDDFGTGYSSLSYLQRLDFDCIKLDRSLVGALPSERAAAIIESVIWLGRSLGARVVAEGVETEAQRDTLRNMGCECAQGYLFSRPMSVDRWEALLRSGLRFDIFTPNRTLPVTRPGPRPI